MATNLQDLRDIWYALLREEESDSSAYPTILMDNMLNSAEARICNGTIINPLNQQAIRKGKLSFLDTSAFYSNVNVTTLTADTTIWAVNIDVADTSAFPTSGNVYIAGNIVAYTGKTATQLTWTTGVEFAHLSWTQVSIIFALPTDFGSIINITYNNNFKLAPKLYDDIWEDLNSYKNGGYNRTDAQWYRSQTTVNPFYTIIGDYFLVFNRNNTGDQIHLRYEKKATKMVATTDETTIPEDYAPYTIPYLALGEMLYNRWEEGRGAELINFGLWKVKEMYTFYNNKSYESINWVQYKSGKSKLNI
jgi:hypothetical protein